MILPFILTALAGFSTLIGVLPIFFKIKNTKAIIAFACSFAAGVMISISIFDLILEAINYFKYSLNPILVIILTILFIFIGINLSFLIDNKINKISRKGNLYKVGIITMLAIILHNIPEGIITYIVSKNDISLGISLCLAIALHNIPEGISIAIPIYYSTKSKKMAFLYTLISALSELLGAFMTWLFLEKYINTFSLGILFSIIAGIMLEISFDELIPTGKNYDKNKSIWFFLCGFIVMLISLLLH